MEKGNKKTEKINMIMMKMRVNIMSNSTNMNVTFIIKIMKE